MRDDVAAVIPAYQCAETIGAVVAALRRRLEHVVVVDDGSRDATEKEAQAAGAATIRLAENRGKGAALRRGIDAALELGVDALVLLDGDGQHDPADLDLFLRAWDDDIADLVIGSRMAAPHLIPKERYWTNYIGTRILSWMTGMELEDSQSGYRLAAADLLDSMDLRSSRYAIESEMIIKAAHRDARIDHVPIRTIYEETGRSHYRPLRDTVRISCAAVYFKLFDEA